MIRIKSAEATTRECEQCKGTFVPMKGSAGRFCSRACSGKYRTANKEKFYCTWCGKLIEHAIVRTQGFKNFFCSVTCNARHRASQLPTVTERYWANVTKPDDPEACWGWTSFVDEHGYGRMNVKRDDGTRSFKLAHRHSWEVHNGPIPEGLGVLHTCDNPPCSNPKHLFLGTQTDNMQDCMAKGRKPVGEQCSYARLTAEQVIEIRARYAAGGVSHQALAREFNVARQHIGDIVNGGKWKHLP